MSDRIPAYAYWLERLFGEQVPKCRECDSLNISQNYHRMTYECRDCGRIEASENVLMVPKDERIK